MSEFDEWMKKEDPFNGNADNADCLWAIKFMKMSFDAGQRSQKQIIEELQSENELLNSQLERAIGGHTQYTLRTHDG